MLDVRPMLPVGNYTIKKDEYQRLYFEQVDSFLLGYKIYGDSQRQVDRIMQTFTNRPNATGVLLTGEKGSGKTLLAKMLSIKCAEQNIPTIIINTPWRGEEFNTLIQSLEQETLILFDEFEKVYDEKEQTAILTLLDGVFPSKKLFVLTCNDKWRIDQHMQNRPGRIFYLLDFHGLDIKFITEYCNDVLNDKSQISNVCRVSSMFAEFNFDLLKALCEEMNRYNETAQEAIKMLNAKPQEHDGGRFKVTLRINNIVVPENETSPVEWRGNPVARENFMIKQVSTYDIDDDGDGAGDNNLYPGEVSTASVSGGEGEGEPSAIDTVKHQFTYLHLKKVDPITGTFVYSNDSGAAVTFTRIKEKFNFYAF